MASTRSAMLAAAARPKHRGTKRAREQTKAHAAHRKKGKDEDGDEHEDEEVSAPGRKGNAVEDGRAKHEHEDGDKEEEEDEEDEEEEEEEEEEEDEDEEEDDGEGAANRSSTSSSGVPQPRKPTALLPTATRVARTRAAASARVILINVYVVLNFDGHKWHKEPRPTFSMVAMRGEDTELSVCSVIRSKISAQYGKGEGARFVIRANGFALRMKSTRPLYGLETFGDVTSVFAVRLCDEAFSVGTLDAAHSVPVDKAGRLEDKGSAATLSAPPSPVRSIAGFSTSPASHGMSSSSHSPSQSPSPSPSQFPASPASSAPSPSKALSASPAGNAVLNGSAGVSSIRIRLSFRDAPWTAVRFDLEVLAPQITVLDHLVTDILLQLQRFDSNIDADNVVLFHDRTVLDARPLHYSLFHSGIRDGDVILALSMPGAPGEPRLGRVAGADDSGSAPRARQSKALVAKFKPTPGHIIMCIRDEDGDLMYFKVRSARPLRKVLDAYGEWKGVFWHDLLFVYRGRNLDANKSPEELGISHMSTVECYHPSTWQFDE